jgi:hypothetical protein
MAGAAELIKAISDVTGLAQGTVFDLDRRLVKGNLRPVGGRGPNAARMGPLEAARLLTAVLASPQLKEAAEAVLRYAQTRPDKAQSSEDLFEATGLAELTTLPARHGFVEALAALIASCANGSLAKLTAGGKQKLQIEALAFTRATHGRLRISGLGRPAASVEYLLAGNGTSRSSKVGKRSMEQAGDLEESRRITERTILSVAELFARE